MAELRRQRQRPAPSWLGLMAATSAAGTGRERHFEVVAGKVIDARGAQHRFAFARNGPATASGGVQAGACRGRGGGGHAGDGAVRRRCRAVAATARCAARCHDRAGLVARRCPLRARAAGGPPPGRGPSRRVTLPTSVVRALDACEVVSLARALDRLSAANEVAPAGRGPDPPGAGRRQAVRRCRTRSGSARPTRTRGLRA